MKKVEKWEANDGELFGSSLEAETHEARLDEISYFEDAFFPGMIECGEDIVNLLDGHRERILIYLGIKEN